MIVMSEQRGKSFLMQVNYNHGQKSWDKFTFVALFHKRQTNSDARIHLDLFSPPPAPIQCWTRVHAISPEFQHCIEGGGGGGQRGTHFERIFKLRFTKTLKINASTKLSQGILSAPIVDHTRELAAEL